MGAERALAGIALDYIVITAPLSVLSFAAALGEGSLRAAVFGFLCLATLAFGVWMLRWALSRPWLSATPTPTPVTVAFIAFVPRVPPARPRQ